MATIELDYTESAGTTCYVGLIVPDVTDEEAIAQAATDLSGLPREARNDIRVTGDTTVEVTFDTFLIDL